MSTDLPPSAIPAPGGPLVDVHLLAVPVMLHARSTEHNRDLQREFQLIEAHAHDSDATPLPRRLLRIVEELTQQYGGFTAEQDLMLESARSMGKETIDELVFHVPQAAGAAATHLGELLDEADAYCRAGEHLLTLATPDELVLYRRWYLGQFTDQVAGRPAVPWPEWSSAMSSR